MTLLAITYLVTTELRYNFQTVTRERVHVNATSPTGLDVEFDISLPQVPCSLLNIDANDPTGQPQSFHLDRQHHIWKHRVKLTEDGNIRLIGDRTKLEVGSTLRNEAHLIEEMSKLGVPNGTTPTAAVEEEPEEELCGSCYGAAGSDDECCDTCEDVKRAYKRKGWHITDLSTIEQCQNEMEGADKNDNDEGCNVHGIIALSSGGGNFHLAPGRSLDSLHHDANGEVSIFDVLMKTFEQWNVSHSIHKVSFGDEFPGHTHQLDGEWRTIVDAYGMYQYYFQVVPTKYVFLNGTVIETNQFSVTEHLRHVNPGGGRGLPGVFFFYEISPLHVEIVEEYQRGWVHFFTSVCAVVGGVVTIMGMLDQFIHSRGSPSGSGQLLG
eukprot:CAMPEP_0119552778 /NCGR_PEP_ID=MMETSP1352-20130426/5695_1 /TAXON_ID=265584 /ORGANISM="Stauroneis constricta, Strain CCMP1120" /LENGTH=379 /DNA_ID=CAMNT_0007599073 /DNA_START=68 /DNA_END=1207 /DNA_ORIENTATION=+